MVWPSSECEDALNSTVFNTKANQRPVIGGIDKWIYVRPCNWLFMSRQIEP